MEPFQYPPDIAIAVKRIAAYFNRLSVGTSQDTLILSQGVISCFSLLECHFEAWAFARLCLFFVYART
jgi:hypothetical protein